MRPGAGATGSGSRKRPKTRQARTAKQRTGRAQAGQTRPQQRAAGQEETRERQPRRVVPAEQVYQAELPKTAEKCPANKKSKDHQPKRPHETSSKVYKKHKKCQTISQLQNSEEEGREEEHHDANHGEHLTITLESRLPNNGNGHHGGKRESATEWRRISSRPEDGGSKREAGTTRRGCSSRPDSRPDDGNGEEADTRKRLQGHQEPSESSKENG